MTSTADSRIIQLPTTRAFEERRARQEFTQVEYDQLRSLIPDLGLEGAPFDEVSWAYPLEIPARLRVVVLEEDPRVVSVGLRDSHGRFVGVVGDGIFEQACIEHPSAMLYAVGKVVERQKGEKAYLNLRPRGWILVEEGGRIPASQLPSSATGARKRTRTGRRN